MRICYEGTKILGLREVRWHCEFQTVRYQKIDSQPTPHTNVEGRVEG